MPRAYEDLGLLLWIPVDNSCMQICLLLSSEGTHQQQRRWEVVASVAQLQVEIREIVGCQDFSLTGRFTWSIDNSYHNNLFQSVFWWEHMCCAISYETRLTRHLSRRSLAGHWFMFSGLHEHRLESNCLPSFPACCRQHLKRLQITSYNHSVVTAHLRPSYQWAEFVPASLHHRKTEEFLELTFACHQERRRSSESLSR